MDWWAWILLWLAIVALSLLFLGYLAYRIFRGFTGLMNEAGQAADRLAPDFDRGGDSEARRPAVAVFRKPADVRAENALSSRLRKWRRLERRVQRRSIRRQPQLLRDLPHL